MSKVAETLAAFPPRIFEFIDSPVSDVPSILTGYDIQVIPSYRGKTRVWRVVQCSTAITWYVKRVQNFQVFGRYVESLDRLGCLARCSHAVRVPTLVGTDFRRLLVATTAVEGVSAQERFVNGTRFDKLMWWPGSDLVGLADVMSGALTALRGFACDPHSDLQDYSSGGTADRIREKLQRLLDVLPETHALVATGVQRALSCLQSLERPRSLLLGDLDLSHLLIENGCLGIVDLDDIGVGDWMRDVAYLLNYIQYRDSNLMYSFKRVERFRMALLAGLGVKGHDPLISLYQVEFCLDHLWAAVPSSSNNELPIHDHSIRSLEKQLQQLLKRVI